MEVQAGNEDLSKNRSSEVRIGKSIKKTRTFYVPCVVLFVFQMLFYLILITLSDGRYSRGEKREIEV